MTWPLYPRQAALLGPPLRPSAEDTELARAAIAARARAPRAIVLGVTSELIGMRWPEGSAVSVVDRSAAMIDSVRGAPATLVQADWRALPFGEASADVAVGDGSLTCLPFPHDYALFARVLARVLAPGGELVVRLFASPVRRETLADVAAALRSRAIGSVHVLKWRLAMAIANGGDIGLADVGRAFDEIVPDPEALAADTGWPRELIATLEAYRRSPVVLSFPSTDAAVAALAPHFALRAVHVPSYELGERCPTVVLRRT